MKPKFRLHFKPTGPGPNRAHYWSCAVTFDTGMLDAKSKRKFDTKHSGPCATPASAIGEATLLLRKYSTPPRR